MCLNSHDSFFSNSTYQERSAGPQRPVFSCTRPFHHETTRPGSRSGDPGVILNRAHIDEINYALNHHCYKLRIAITGSTLVARRAGTKHATSATPHNNSEISANVNGSVALTP